MARLLNSRSQMRALAGCAGAALLAPVLAFGKEPAIRFIRSETLAQPAERQITSVASGHILTNTGVWSPDGNWIVYDIRSTPPGDLFDGDRIEMVNVETLETKVLYRARNGAHCGVATVHPRANKIIFILGPELPTADWQYCAWHRQGVIADLTDPGNVVNLDACQLLPPFTPGALRGGSHVHVWDPAGDWVSFTYEDHVLSGFEQETEQHEVNVGVSAPVQPVRVSKQHPRNHDGEFFSVVATRTVAHPQPGSDEINKACEEGWIGTNGYVRADGTRQNRALAFQGQVLTSKGEMISEVFVVDLPEDVRIQGDGPLAGTQTSRPRPPKGTIQRRLTFTAERQYPGLQGPRHWLRSSPDGRRIAFLMRDDAGVVQLWTISPQGGQAAQLSRNADPIASAFTWSSDGRWIAHVMNTSICVTDAGTGKTRRLTSRVDLSTAPRPEACVFDPAGKRIAYVRPVRIKDKFHNQIFTIALTD